MAPTMKVVLSIQREADDDGPCHYHPEGLNLAVHRVQVEESSLDQLLLL